MEKYNVNEVGIYETYHLIWKEAFYDEDTDSYFIQHFFSVVDYRLGIKKNDKIIDLESSKEFKFFNVGLCVNDLFVNNFRCCVLGDYFPNNDIELSKNTILKKYEKIRTELFEKNYDKMNDLFRFVNDYDIGDYTLKNYYNDTNNDDYYDEYLEHRRSLLYGVNKEERKLKILM